MKKYIQVSLLRSSLWVAILFVVTVAGAFAQTPGMILQPAKNGGDAILDPNRDGFISVTSTGFSGTNDVGEGISEIPYRPLPTLTSETLGDVKNGTVGGHTDFAPPSPLQVYYDGRNLMFRLRVGGISPAARGYSVLIDTDGEFEGTGANPGFEFEVVLFSNSEVRVIDHRGESPQTIFSGTVTQFSQRSQAASTGGNDPDYFYDFYTPITAFGNQISSTTPLRMVASTLNLGRSALSDLSLMADVAGVDFRAYNQDALAAWRDVIGVTPPVTLNNLVANEIPQIRTFAPVINFPITTAATTISGTSREPVGTIIQVQLNGTALGTTTVTATGTWTFTLPAGVTLAEGNRITATATAPNRPASQVSNAVIVTVTVCATPTPAIVGADGPRRVLNGTAAPNAIIRIYRNGILISNSTGATFVTASNTGNWSFRVCQQGGGEGNNNCIGNGVFTATQQIGTGCQSNPSAPFVNLPTTATSPATTISSPVCVSSSTVSGTAAPNSFVTVFLNNRPIYLVTTADNAFTVQANATGNWSFSGNLGFTAGNTLFARARTATTYYGQSANITVTSCETTAPVITGDYCGVTTTVTGTSTEPVGTTIQVYAGGTAVGSPTTVNDNGFWSVTGLSIPQGTAFTARATAPGGTQSPDSEPVTATPQTSAEGLTINSPIVEGAATISGTGPGGTQLTLYIDGTPFTPISITENGAWSITGFSRTEIFPGAEISATVTATGQCESEFAESVIVECEPLITTFSVTSSTPATICGGSTPVVVDLANSQLGVIYTLLADGVESGVSVMGTGDAITITSGPISNTTDANRDVVLSVRARRITGATGEALPASCEAILNETITRSVLPQAPTDYTVVPPSSNVCAGSTVLLQLSSSAEGYTYQLLNEATGDLVGSPMAGTGDEITLSTGPINFNATYSVVITNGENDCVLTDAGRYNAVISGPAIDRPVFATNDRVCVGGPAIINVSTQANAGYLYDVFQVGPGNVVTQIGEDIQGTGNIITVPSAALGTAGTYTFYVEVSSPSCPARRVLQTVTVQVTNDPGTANAGEDQEVCGSEAVLAALSAAPGVGTWSIATKPAGSADPIFANVNNPNTTVSGLVSGIYEFQWSVSTACGGTTTQAEPDIVRITVNCEAFYVVLPPKYRDEYAGGDTLAYTVDSDGGIAAATLLSGTLPPGFFLSPTTGNITVSNPDLLVTGIYELSIRLVDAVGDVTDLLVTIVINEDSPIIIPLPVELVYFTATVRNNQAHLEWLTASELDNDRFEVERSLDARSFEKVGTVKGKGTTSLETKYTFTDRTPVQGTVYYRLKQVDTDGQFAYSNVIAVNAKGLARELATQAYPNPFQDVIKVTLMAPEAQEAVMTIYDMNGRRVVNKDVQLDAGVNRLELNLEQLQSGMYILKVVGQGIESTTRIMKN
ncbi:T9SS type A sorting domain-containing protein [Pontibacter indicus]|uniref:Por secretion system C-terminal sorting domain-containing protein n=1 Tax=Pontibacter indicus TaxID=1317125 RepID=A0A1R3W7J3_9BACT|nr:T9SS type A sorting domain-containing protein [Pontibacter indicus]SIT73696.1 Por secretion system C-terminal sorting domain-containing protein [Pontibacter indicus]